MKTKTPSLALLIAAGLLLSTAPASAYIIYGSTDVNGTTYNLWPNANLSYAYLRKAKLYNADLSYANLSNANLSGADLRYTYMYGADLSYAYLSGADLSGADLSYANLSYANLSWTKLTGVNLTGATVSYSDWTDFSTHSGANFDSYSYDTSLINYANAPAVPEPSTYGLIGIVALGLALAARRRKLKTA
jgi:hypothetical protein